MAILDVVRFNGLKNREWVVYKYPTDGIIWGSQVIIQEGQAAIYVKGGAVYDTMGPGTYTLETKNLPFLSTIVNIPFGRKTPFSAEIYFINTATKLDVHWGTSDPIQLIDPKYYVKLRIRAYGQMGLKINDQVVFFKNLIGGMSQNDIVKFDKIKEFYRGLIVLKVKSIIADTIISEKISALEISTKLEEISEKVYKKIGLEFEKYGFNVISFYVQSVNFPDEDFEKINQILSDKAQFEIMGDNRYATKRSFDIYETAASAENGVAGAITAGGIGVGVGLNMASAMNASIGTPIATESTEFCGKCHAQIKKGSKFCPSCGESQTKKSTTCPECGKEVAEGMKFCSECGFNMQIKMCECGNKIEPGTKFCSHCGKEVE